MTAKSYLRGGRFELLIRNSFSISRKSSSGSIFQTGVCGMTTANLKLDWSG
jgi:hypothetical protein